MWSFGQNFEWLWAIFENNFWLLVPMPIKLCRYTVSILCNVFDAISDQFNHSMAVNVKLWSKLWLTWGNLSKNFGLLVPMPLKLCRYTLLILCNVLDAISHHLNHSNIWLTLGIFLNNFWLVVPMPLKLCRYILLILCNVLDALNDSLSCSIPHPHIVAVNVML